MASFERWCTNGKKVASSGQQGGAHIQRGPLCTLPVACLRVRRKRRHEQCPPC